MGKRKVSSPQALIDNSREVATGEPTMTSIHDTVQRTALYEAHLRAAGRIVPFAGWDMPVNYGSIVEEHHAVRKQAGMFDISHMGEILVEGAGAMDWLNRVLTQDVQRLELGKGQYSFLLNEQGGVIDDLIVYRLGEVRFLLVVNASKVSEVHELLLSELDADVSLENCSANISAVAVQGPEARALTSGLLGASLMELGRYGITEIAWGDAEMLVARTGYTGEDGFEIFCPNDQVVGIWEALREQGVKPCGLGARDSLRLEACLPLNGQDLTPDHTPLEAGLGFAIGWEKPQFRGRDRLLDQKLQGTTRKLVALRGVPGEPPPRHGYRLISLGEPIGEVTSGGFSPTLGTGIALGYVTQDKALPGTRLSMEVRGRLVEVLVVQRPLYRRPA
jgi:aminomethyltransferase